MKASSTKDLWSKKNPPAQDVDSFIKASPKEAQAKLKQLREIIRTTAPKSEESISYRMPVYKMNGKQLVGFAGFKHHVGFYPMSGSFLDAYKKELLRDLHRSSSLSSGEATSCYAHKEACPSANKSNRRKITPYLRAKISARSHVKNSPLPVASA